jgi:crossover junction endodeoxyribonuclease RusA
MLTYEFLLSWPPSVNTYWRFPRMGVASRPLISKEGRAWRKSVAQWVMINRQKLKLRGPMTGRLAVFVAAYPPDRRRRDLDNLLKATLDALQHAGVYLDDEQIDLITVKRMQKTDGGLLSVNVSELGSYENAKVLIDRAPG